MSTDDQELRKLDSSVKRNTALIKKLKLVNEDNRVALMDEIRRSNQSKVIFCCLSLNFAGIHLFQLSCNLPMPTIAGTPLVNKAIWTNIMLQ